MNYYLLWIIYLFINILTIIEKLYHGIEAICRVLRFCWKKIFIWFLTKFKYPNPKGRMVRKRWESMDNYKVELEIKDINNARRLWALYPEPMPGMPFSRN